jgi:hypothetical protein
MKKWRRYVNTIAQFTNVRGIHCGQLLYEMVLLKGSLRMGAASLCKHDLSNEPNFARIHLARQYLLNTFFMTAKYYISKFYRREFAHKKPNKDNLDN